MYREYLLALYSVYFIQTRRRIFFIERWLTLKSVPPPPTEDDKRNEQQTYNRLFSQHCLPDVEDIYLTAMQEMRVLPFTQSDEILNGLSFLQEIISTAMWKHHCSVGKLLETFAREFDRLDVEAERKRLHAQAQQM